MQMIDKKLMVPLPCHCEALDPSAAGVEVGISLETCMGHGIGHIPTLIAEQDWLVVDVDKYCQELDTLQSGLQNNRSRAT